MTQLSLENIPTAKKEAAKKKKLLLIIQKKRIQLQEAVIKTETLRVSLEMAKQEYMVKVGSLFLKDNHLDLEIIRYKNILKLMEEGRTYDQAVEELADTFYAQQIEIEREQRKIKEEEQIMLKREEHASDENSGDIKKLWKKLIARFHPDLVQDVDEKKKRDTVMKQINRAYQEGDFDQLFKIDKDNMAHFETSIDNLEDILLMIMNDIEKQKEEYRELKGSEWFDWMERIERAKKKAINIFADTERMLLDDIVVKYDILNALKAQIRERDNTASLL
ncbi:MAG: hypothetical protein H0W89_05695 [Candidatus Levybacteria bacterium]|nr:hypothetical protein [Candidatus Levybacteria bacterium]